MATAIISPDQDAVLAEIFIAAPPERVFEALSDPGQRRQWWGQQGFYRVTETYSDLRPGGKWVSRGIFQNDTTFEVGGEYLQVDPPRRLVYTWNPNWIQVPETIVTWELEPRDVHGLQHRGPQRMGTGTLVKIRHTGFAGYPKEAADHSQGWMRSLSWLLAFVERGETIDTRLAS